MTPQPNTSYYAKIEGDDTPYPLPNARKTGYTIQVDDNSQENIQISISSKKERQRGHKVHLLIQTRGMMTYATEIGLAADFALFNVPKELLKNGVSQITLFDSQFKPQAERLIYHYNKDALDAEISAKESYRPREETSIKITVRDAQGNPVKGNFSMAVVDENQIKTEHMNENIASSLLLASDILGQIENSAKYVNNSQNTDSEQLDLLLMTKGWRRFKWKELLEKGTPEPEYIAEQGFSVSGQAFKQNGKPLKNGSVKHIALINGNSNFDEAPIQVDGSFTFENLQYYEEDGFVMASDKRGNNNSFLKIAPQSEIQYPVITKDLDPSILSPSVSSAFYEEGKERELNDEAYDISGISTFLKRSEERKSVDSVFKFNNSQDLGTFEVSGSSEKRIFENISRGLIYNRGTYSFSVPKLMGTGQKFANPIFMLQGRVPGLTIILNGSIDGHGEPFIKLDRKNAVPVDDINRPPTVYFIDDMPVFLSDVLALPMERVQRVEVLKGIQAFQTYGEYANGGAIAVYTKTAEEYTEFMEHLLERMGQENNSTIHLPGGYYLSKEFYAPKYATDLPEHIKPDRRALIHWEPIIKTGDDGVAEVSFYNADLETTIHVILEGVSDRGQLLSKNWSYEVSKIKQ